MRTAIEYLDSPSDEVDQHGWYIVEYDNQGYSYDAIGPYDSEAEAIEVNRSANQRENEMLMVYKISTSKTMKNGSLLEYEFYVLSKQTAERVVETLREKEFTAAIDESSARLFYSATSDALKAVDDKFTET